MAKLHRDNWQNSRLLEDAIRVEVVQPLSQAVFWTFWSQNNGNIMLVLRDLKPDSVLFRKDGTMAVVDHGSGATFSVAGKTHK